jgi:hypothetical protein
LQELSDLGLIGIDLERSREGAAGAARFSSGKGRHGEFGNI